VRLATFLVRRARGSASYKDGPLKSSQERTKAMTPGAKLGMWLGTSLLYCAMAAPAYCTLAAGRELPSLLPSLPLMYAGLALEAVADEQKQAAKRERPQRFVSTGGCRRCCSGCCCSGCCCSGCRGCAACR
jgi:hypothetical protein